MACAVSRPGTSGLRASGTAPAKWGGAVSAAEHPYEVVRISVPYSPADLLDREVGIDQQPARLRHAPFADPLQNRPPRLAPDDRGEVSRREPHGPCHVLERDPLVVALLDEAEYPRDQGLVLEPQVPHNVHRQPRELHEQERQVRKGCRSVAVPPLAELGVEGREALGPRGPLRRRYPQALSAGVARAPHEGEQQRVGAPGEERARRLGHQDLRREEDGPSLFLSNLLVLLKPIPPSPPTATRRRSYAPPFVICP